MAPNWRQLKDFYLQNLKTNHIKYGIGKKYTFQADTAAYISFSYIPKKKATWVCDQLRIISDNYFSSVGVGPGLYLARDHIN